MLNWRLWTIIFGILVLAASESVWAASIFDAVRFRTVRLIFDDSTKNPRIGLGYLLAIDDEGHPIVITAGHVVRKDQMMEGKLFRRVKISLFLNNKISICGNAVTVRLILFRQINNSMNTHHGSEASDLALVVGDSLPVDCRNIGSAVPTAWGIVAPSMGTTMYYYRGAHKGKSFSRRGPVFLARHCISYGTCFNSAAIPLESDLINKGDSGSALFTEIGIFGLITQDVKAIRWPIVQSFVQSCKIAMEVGISKYSKLLTTHSVLECD